MRCMFLFLSLPVSFFLCEFFVCWCLFLGFPLLLPVFVFFGLPFPCLVPLSFKKVLRSTFMLRIPHYLHLSPQQCLVFRHLFDFRSFILFCVTLLANSFLFLCSSNFLFIIVILIILFTCPQTQDDANFECRAFPR